MEHMRMIIQIQAQIDSCLVDGGEDGLLLSSLAGGGARGGEPDPRLVKQAIRLLRMRHRVLRVRCLPPAVGRPRRPATELRHSSRALVCTNDDGVQI